LRTTIRKRVKGTLYRGALIQVSPEAGGYCWMFRRGRFDTYGMGLHVSAAEAFQGAVEAIDEELRWEGGQR
jgi:hypothetical protein